mgnify:CR=1 FL=1
MAFIPYPGPIPPRPADGSTDAQAWDLWFRYEQAKSWWDGAQEREAARTLAAERVIVTDRQHTEKMAAEAACAAAQQAHAAAMRFAAERQDAPYAYSDKDLLRMFMTALAEAGITGAQALSAASASVFMYRRIHPEGA